MINIARIISDVQNEINDLSGDIIQIGEYLDMLYDISLEVGQKTQIYIGRYTVTPITEDNPTDLVNYITIPYRDSNNNIIAPYKILRIAVITGDGIANAREWSYTSIMRTNTDIASIRQTEINFADNSVFTILVGTDEVTIDNRTIIFPYNFNLGDKVEIDFIQSIPFVYSKWDSLLNFNIPDVLINSYREGLKWRVMERLYNRGWEGYGQRAIRAQQLYERELRKAITYTHNLKDESSTPRTFPHIWLPE